MNDGISYTDKTMVVKKNINKNKKTRKESKHNLPVSVVDE